MGKDWSRTWVRDKAGLGEGLPLRSGKWGEVRRKNQHGAQSFFLIFPFVLPYSSISSQEK